MASTPTKQQSTAAPDLQAEGRDFLLQLKQILERAYRDGIDRFLSWDVEGETIVGQFQDGPKVFDFRLAEGELDYGVSESGRRKVLDTLILEYPELEALPAAQQTGFLMAIRQDAARKNCKGVSSYSCGESCISNKKRCRVNANAVTRNPEEIRSLVASAKKLKSQGVQSPALPQIPLLAGAMGTAGAIAVGAAVTGVPVASYVAFRTNYRKGFAESGQQAKAMAQAIEVPDLGKDKSSVTLTIGGLAGDAKGGNRLKDELGKFDLGDHHFVPISNEGFDIRTPEEEEKGIDRSSFGDNPVAADEFVMRAFGTFSRSVLEQGRNPVAVRAAAQAYAYHQKYPDKPINLLGHSAGGITAHETAEILEGLGVKTKVIAIGSPYMGLTQATKDTVTIGTKKDSILKSLGYSVMNGHWINSVTGHSVEEYFRDPEFQQFLTQTLKRSRLDAEGKQCGRGYIAADKECRVGKESAPTPRTPRQKRVATPARGSAALRKPQLDKADRAAIAGLESAARIGVMAGASLMGVSVAAWAVQKARFEAGYSKSAELAKAQAEKYALPKDLKAGFRSTKEQGSKEETLVESQYGSAKPTQLSFFVGGFGGVSGKEGDYLGEEFSAMFPDHHTVGIESPEFDVTPKKGDRVYHPDFLLRAAKTVVGDAIKEGRNPVAVRIAARAYAYHQAHPDLPINLIGQSGGSMPTREAAEILDRMGVKDVKVVATAGPYFGMTKPRGLSLVNTNDPFEKVAGWTMPRKAYVNAKGHSLYYVEDGAGGAKDRAQARRSGNPTQPNPDTQRVLRDYFDRSRKDAGDEDAGAARRSRDVAALERGLRSLIQQSYGDGVDRLLYAALTDRDEVVGQFVDGGRTFEYRLTDTTLEYQPARQRFTLQGFRQDAKNCSGATSYPCGETCISNDKVCRVGRGALPDGETLKRFVASARFTIESQGIPVAQPTSRSGAQVNSPILLLLPFTPVITGALSTSIAMGVGAAGYLALRAKYRAGIGESAKIVQQMARDTPVEPIGNKTHVTFTTGGFAGDGKGGIRLKDDLERIGGFAGHHFVPVTNEGFDINEYIEGKSTRDVLKFVKGSMATLGRTVLRKGYNPTAREIAARAYAYHQRYPSATISLVGHSGGGIASHEAAEILDRLGVKTQVAAIGSPYFEFSKPTERTMTFASPNDPLTTGIMVMNPQWFDDVAGHDTSDYFRSPRMVSELKNFLGGTDAGDRAPVAAGSPTQRRRDAVSPDQQKFLVLLRRILERSYTDRFDRFLTIDVDAQGNPSGSFQDSNKIVGFTFTGKTLSTKLLRSTRTDAPRRARRKKSKCTIGITCRNTCISGKKSCRVATGDIASDRELSTLRQLGKSVKTPAPAAQPEEQSIRELKKEAQKRGIYRYSSMSKEELKRAISAADDNPEQQERLRKTFEKRKAEREAIEGTKAASYAKAWKQIERVMKLSGIRPELAAASVASILVGVSIKTWQDIRQQYRSGLKDSAATAAARAEKIEVSRTPKSNITFAVGGFRGDGSSGGEIKQRLEESDKWFKQSNEIIAIDSDDFDIPPTPIPKRLPDGSYNPAYLGYVGSAGLGAAFRNLFKQRNEASVELAAQIYAQANAGRLNKLTNRVEPIHSEKTINIVAHGAGGMVAREAIDILAEMPDGKKLLRRVNFVAMGSPDFGFTEQTIDREMTLSSPNDPYSLLPARKEKRVPSVKGHEIEDYLTNGDAIAQITRFLGKGRTSTYYEERRAERERRKAAKERTRRPRARNEDPPRNDSIGFQILSPTP